MYTRSRASDSSSSESGDPRENQQNKRGDEFSQGHETRPRRADSEGLDENNRSPVVSRYYLRSSVRAAMARSDPEKQPGRLETVVSTCQAVATAVTQTIRSVAGGISHGVSMSPSDVRSSVVRQSQTPSKGNLLFSTPGWLTEKGSVQSPFELMPVMRVSGDPRAANRPKEETSSREYPPYRSAFETAQGGEARSRRADGIDTRDRMSHESRRNTDQEIAGMSLRKSEQMGEFQADSTYRIRDANLYHSFGGHESACESIEGAAKERIVDVRSARGKDYGYDMAQVSDEPYIHRDLYGRAGVPNDRDRRPPQPPAIFGIQSTEQGRGAAWREPFVVGVGLIAPARSGDRRSQPRAVDDGQFSDTNIPLNHLTL